MFYALSWLVVLTLVALWSLLAWSLNAVVAWALAGAGSIAGTASGGSVFRVPEWLTPWIPQEIAQLAASLASGFSTLLVDLPEQVLVMSSGLSVVIWIVWVLGSVLLVGCGVLAHRLAARWRRPQSRPMTPTKLLMTN